MATKGDRGPIHTGPFPIRFGESGVHWFKHYMGTTIDGHPLRLYTKASMTVIDAVARDYKLSDYTTAKEQLEKKQKGSEKKPPDLGVITVVDDKDKFATITFGVDQGLLHRPEWATPSEKFRVIDLSEAQPHLD